MPARSRAILALASAGYGLAVLAGTALLGFVIAPVVGIAFGLFPIEADGRAFFSLLTLRGVPYLMLLAALSGLAYPALSRQRIPRRILLYVVNVLVAWLIGASIALAILG
jgi:hypothetical protein